ncbi:glutamate synthase-related protein [Methanohalophilus portucalensis]|uniref:Archaeal glutamate synthase [NADPH] n=2 Tax=Methanohalophilus portucalensis TaxID=39664 RepID=A0A1L9C3V0_9EURY|nr:glutamate synthase-related protein [Methanohalophilus portucalensis]ATU07452.1 FMN-binding glutamate synthase family protein [Methanohalophilus portucalensis]OJH49088.1 glutamate synthase (NADPH) GltB2 subunit [Methanohalophilus portucalensis FDF-1]RNI08107.1 4Fe-4S dicluster domain-containing protein [Methanohalophilus portucalensis FDF-1]SMH39121.1 glutamate synthase (NADPH) GltB2 subunit [Methanohalophilus portucalensis FDF-1]
MSLGSVPLKYRIQIDRQQCMQCMRCVDNCSYGVFREEDDGNILIDSRKCTACHRCISMCPRDAINLSERPVDYRSHPLWTPEAREDVINQSRSGRIVLAGMGNAKDYPIIYDRLVLDACQVTNPSIDPLREPMELRTYLGQKPSKLDIRKQENGEIELNTKLSPNLELQTPIMIGHMSYGAISLNAQLSLAKAAAKTGTYMGTGEGGLHKDIYPYQDNMIVQVASGRFGVDINYLDRGAAIEIKIGQGAKPGIGGHLPGEKVCTDVSCTRMIPAGSDAISPAPHHDIYSIEDLAQLVRGLKEATEWKKPVFVKIAAVHNVAAVAAGIARSSADAVVIDGFRGGTGASPKVFRDNVGIPIEAAIASVDQKLNDQGIRNKVSVIASGGIRNSADIAKSIALGADAVYIGTAALISMGCRVCGNCYRGLCPWGIATQREDLVSRLDPEVESEHVANLINSWTLELSELMGAAGINSIESLRGNRSRLRGYMLDEGTLDVLQVKPVGA